MVPAVDRAPLVSWAWWVRRASVNVSTARLIWSPLSLAGPLISQSRVPSMLRVTCSTSWGAPSMNWLTTKARMPPKTARPRTRTKATAPPRAAP